MNRCTTSSNNTCVSKTTTCSLSGPWCIAWPALKAAFRSDFNNGDIKTFMGEFLKDFITREGLKKVFICNAPVNNSATNSRVTTEDPRVTTEDPIRGEHGEYDDTKSITSSSLSLTGISCMVVPDMIIYHLSQPLFVFALEFKKASDNFKKGVKQNLKQVLSQMHNQNINFGITLSPMKWHIMVVQKVSGRESNGTKLKDGIQIWQQEFKLSKLADAKNHTFDVESFTKLLDLICNIISFMKSM